MRKKLFSSKRVTGALAFVMAIALALGGTFAWSKLDYTAKNTFKGAPYEAELVDIFTPPDNWQNGETINKDVYGKNTGSDDIFVRINFDEILKIKGESDQATAAKDIGFVVNGDGTADNTSFGKFEWELGNGTIKDIADWTGCEDTWFYDSTTGWFYWGNVLKPGEQTHKILDAVKLIADIDKEFEYIINVNMNAFSADQKGIDEMEEADTDAGVAIPDEVKNAIKDLVNNNDSAVQKKADKAREEAKDIQNKIDAGKYDGDQTAKDAAEKAVEDYNKAADKYEDALAETDKDAKKDLLDEADNLSATARNNALIAKATITRSELSLPGMAGTEGSIKSDLLSAINKLKDANSIRELTPEKSKLAEAYENHAIAIIERAQETYETCLKFGTDLPNEERVKSFVSQQNMYLRGQELEIAKLEYNDNYTLDEKEKRLELLNLGVWAIDQTIQTYNYNDAGHTDKSAFYSSLFSASRNTTKFPGASISSWEKSLIVDEDNLVAYYDIDGYGSIYGIAAFTDFNGGTVSIPNTYNGKNITAIGNNAITIRNANEVILPDSVKWLGNYSARSINAVTGQAYKDPVTFTVGVNSSLKSIGSYAMDSLVIDNDVEFPTTLTSIESLSFTNVTAPKITFNSTPTIYKDAFKDAKIGELVFPAGTAFDDSDLGTFTGKVTIGGVSTNYVNGVAKP